MKRLAHHCARLVRRHWHHRHGKGKKVILRMNNVRSDQTVTVLFRRAGR